MLYQYLQPTVAGSLFCSRYWMMLVQHDSGERSKLGFIHRWPEMCWVCSLMQTWWPGGSPLWCTSASHCHCVGDRACSCCSTSTFSAPTPWLFGQKVRILHGPSPTYTYTVCYARGVDLDSKCPTEHNMRKPGGLLGMLHWACSKDKVKLVVSSLSAMVLFFRFTPCCKFLI